MIILATSNPNKIKEYMKIYPSFDYRVIDDKFDIVEDGVTYLENSLIKATKYFEFTHECVMADDSGLEIKSLGNFPGIYSSRFMHPIKDYKIKCNALLDKLKDIKDRSARFVCSIVLIAKDGTKYESIGYLNGTIAGEIRGSNGFGYDSIFIPDGYTKTLGELEDDVKHMISHRKIAFDLLLQKLPLKLVRYLTKGEK